MPSRRQLLTLGGACLSSAGVIGYSLFYKDGVDSDTIVPDGGSGDEPDGSGTDENGENTDETGTEDRFASEPGVLDVRNYGAKGDGETDDSAAIQEAIRSAEPGETVLLPETSDAYLLSFKGNGDEAAIELGKESKVEDILIKGETPAPDAQTLRVEPGSYDPDATNWVIKIHSNDIIDGLRIENLTIDGGRPDDDVAAGLNGEDSMKGIQLVDGNANGGHDIVIQNCLVRDCSSTALRFQESGVTCRNVTVRRAGRHAFNPVADDTKVDPAFVGESIKAVNCGGTGIDHRRGTARVENVYTENNRSGNKWKHLIERLEVINHHSVSDRNRGWRSNHSNDADGKTPPESQEITFKEVFIEGANINGIRVSGNDTTVKYDFNGVEVRNCSVDGADGAIDILREAETLNSGTGRVVVVGTNNGEGIYTGVDGSLHIDLYEHFNNDGGPFVENSGGEFTFNQERVIDPGRNVFNTPTSEQVGAFIEASE